MYASLEVNFDCTSNIEDLVTLQAGGGGYGVQREIHTVIYWFTIAHTHPHDFKGNGK